MQSDLAITGITVVKLLIAEIKIRSIFFIRWGGMKYKHAVTLFFNWPHMDAAGSARLPARRL
jgi:hypothetical protein